MGFYFGNHQLETVNKNPIHPIAFLKNHVNSKLLAKVRDGSCFFFPASPSLKRQKKPHPPWGFSQKIPVVIMEGWFSFHLSITPLLTGTLKLYGLKLTFLESESFHSCIV